MKKTLEQRVEDLERLVSLFREHTHDSDGNIKVSLWDAEDAVETVLYKERKKRDKRKENEDA